MEKHSRNSDLVNENIRLKRLLQESENQRLKERFILHKFDLFNKNTPLGVIEWDLNSLIIDWNKSAESIFGYSKEEMLGKAAIDYFVPEKSKELTHNIWQLLIENSGGRRSTNENITKSGKTIVCEWYNIPLIDEQGKVTGVSSLVLDITEKLHSIEKLEESNKRSKMLSELTFEGIIIHKEGLILEANTSIERISLYPREELIGKNIVDLLVVDKYKPVALENILIQSTKPYEVKARRKNGTEFWMEIEAKNYTHNNQPVRAVALRDITQRKQAELKLKNALFEAQESERLKSSFLSTISHELRTPLNAVIGFSDLIDESMDIEEAISLAKMIHKSGNHLLEIINDIFDLSMLEEGTVVITKESFNLHALFDEIQENIYLEKQKMGKQMLALNFILRPEDKDIEINTDHKRIKQIFIHLLKNALKYTREGSIEVGFSSIPNALQFYVKDTGIGIPKEKQKHIFSVFRQLDDRHTREFEGVGIGLSIAKTLCENLGGVLSVESEEGVGSTFFFTIPHKTSEENHAPVKVNGVIDLSVLNDKTILIAEDDAGSFELLEMYLKPWKMKILWAKNGVQAIDIFTKNKHIDLILMDIKMPILSGYEAAKEIKLISPKTPIIAQTAYAINNEKDIALQAGCDDYISKPISWTILSKKMASHLQNVTA